MGRCRSGKVEDVVENTQNALSEIRKIEDLLESDSELRETEFIQKIDEYYSHNDINDQHFGQGNHYIKVEYSSQFSLDKIANVVKEALSAVSNLSVGGNINGITSEEAIESYSDVIVAIGEAAKTSSYSGFSSSFSSTRLAPGVMAFIYASSTNIKDSATFGDESVTGTAIHYRLVESVQDYALSEDRDLNIDRISSLRVHINKLRGIQIDLLDKLDKGLIDLNEFEKLYAVHAEKIKDMERKVQNAIDDITQPKITSDKFKLKTDDSDDLDSLPKIRSDINRKLVNKLIERLSKHGDKYKKVIEMQKKRLAENYY